jgi:hypothetical protein
MGRSDQVYGRFWLKADISLTALSGVPACRLLRKIDAVLDLSWLCGDPRQTIGLDGLSLPPRIVFPPSLDCRPSF